MLCFLKVILKSFPIYHSTEKISENTDIVNSCSLKPEDLLCSGTKSTPPIGMREEVATANGDAASECGGTYPTRHWLAH